MVASSAVTRSEFGFLKWRGWERLQSGDDKTALAFYLLTRSDSGEGVARPQAVDVLCTDTAGEEKNQRDLRKCSQKTGKYHPPTYLRISPQPGGESETNVLGSEQIATDLSGVAERLRFGASDSSTRLRS